MVRKTSHQIYKTIVNKTFYINLRASQKKVHLTFLYFHFQIVIDMLQTFYNISSFFMKAYIWICEPSVYLIVCIIFNVGAANIKKHDARVNNNSSKATVNSPS